MKRVVTLFLVIIPLTLIANDYEQFLQAQEWYKKNEYEKAQITYESLDGKRPSVWHNAGSCAYKQGNYVTSVNVLAPCTAKCNAAALPST